MPRRRRDEEDDEDDYEDDDYSSKRRRPCAFIDVEAEEDDDDDEYDDEDSEAEDDFIAPDDDGGFTAGEASPELKNRPRPRPILRPHEEEERELEYFEKVQKRFEDADEYDYDDEDEDELTQADQQALLPSITDPKLWMVKCAVGRERELATCLMQKFLDVKELKILSAIALPTLKSYVYVEAYKEAHVREACKGLRAVFGSAKIIPVPVKEMPAVVTVQCEPVSVSTGAWVRVKTGAYKGDLAQVVQVDNVRRQVLMKMIPRIDLAALIAKLEGKEVVKKVMNNRPAQRFMYEEEARAMYLPMKLSRDGFMVLEDGSNMKFKDGFLYKTLSDKSILTKNIQPTVDEIDMFRKNEKAEREVKGLTDQFSSLRKRHFAKNDKVVIVNGDLKNLKCVVEKVEGNIVHVKPCPGEGLQMSLTVRQNEICKCFEPGNQVKAVGGADEGSTGMVVRIEGNTVSILSDRTKKLVRVFSDDIVATTEVLSQVDNDDDYRQQPVTTRRPPQQLSSRFERPQQPPSRFERPPRGGGGRVGGPRGGGTGGLVGSKIKIRVGPYKGCLGLVKEVKGNMVRVELEAQMRVVTVQRDQITETVEGNKGNSGSFRGRGSETPVHQSRTPLRPCMTPARDYGGATPVHEGMRTPMRHRAWNPYEPMTPTRDVLSYQ